MQADDALRRNTEICLVTVGRKTGIPREVEVWFAFDALSEKLVFLAHEESQWWKNIAANGKVRYRLPGNSKYREGIAKVLPKSDKSLHRVLELFNGKYGKGPVWSWYGDGDGRVVVEIPIS
ncbi:MAG: nitroreductase family deazaflavin-dependent oxidoreductase [Nitrososphaerota archaeon]|nr:nitroreductase family deazaflavin-dependent oxidoreductase [Nitrososphaerota archaeon]